MGLTEEQAALRIQRAVKARTVRKRENIYYTTRQAELEVLRQQHRLRLEAKEREFLYLSKLPPNAVMALAIRKQEQAVVRIQALWRGYKARKMHLNRPNPIPVPLSHAPRRPIRAPQDNFYKPLHQERIDHLVKQIRMEGKGSLEQYLNNYSTFLEKQVHWEQYRQDRASYRFEIKNIMNSLSMARYLGDELHYKVQDPTAHEIALAKDIHFRRIPDPKK